MNNENEEEETILTEEGFAWLPTCCKELWDSCQHIPVKERPAKRNIGL